MDKHECCKEGKGETDECCMKEGGMEKEHHCGCHSDE